MFLFAVEDGVFAYSYRTLEIPGKYVNSYWRPAGKIWDCQRRRMEACNKSQTMRLSAKLKGFYQRQKFVDAPVSIIS